MLDTGSRTLGVRCLRGALWGLMRVLFRIEHRGFEKVPPAGPILIVPNHVCYFDPFWIGVAIHRRLRFMAWDRIFAIPGVASLFRWLAAFPVSLAAPESSAYRASLEILRRGEALMIFPEGGRSPDGSVQPFKEGAARLALRGGATIVPVAILGGHDVWGPQRWLPRPRKVVVECLDPIPCPRASLAKAEFDSAAASLTAQIRSAIAARVQTIHHQGAKTPGEERIEGA